MDSHAYPWPIPLLRSAYAMRPAGTAGNSAYPIGLLQMPVQVVAWLLYRAATAKQIIEWTPLAAGPGTRVSYTGAAGWDGTKFTHEDSVVSFLDPLEFLPPWGAQYATPQAARDGVRGYDALTAEDPESEDWTYLQKPGQWIDSGPWAAANAGTDGSMRYDIDANWPGQGGVFTASVAAELAAWGQRLNDWLDAEEAKVPPNTALIAEIQRQITVSVAIGTQITNAATLTLAAIDDLPTTDQGKTNQALYEQDSFSRWIAAEEILEAFTATNMPLNLFRADFVEWTKHYLARPWFGRGALHSSTLLNVEFLTAGLTTAALGALTTAEAPTLSTSDLPALSTGQIAVNLTRPLVYAGPAEPYGYDPAFRTIFTAQLSSLDTDGITMLTTEQITALGPAAIGLSAEACLVPQGAVIPVYGNGVTQSPAGTQSFPVLAGVPVGLFRLEDGTAIGTQAIPGIKLYECPLFANAERVGALNITWRILTTRS